MYVLVACEESQEVCKAFRARGHQAFSCDIQECSGGHPEWHIKGDALMAIKARHIFTAGGRMGHYVSRWDLIIAHPPCTRLTCTGNKWYKPEYRERFPHILEEREQAVRFFMAIANADCPRIVIENPVGIMSSRWRKPDQYIEPYHFGDPARKKTGLWLKGVPPLVPDHIVEPLVYTYANGKTDPLWHWQTRNLPPVERAKVRSKTFPGIARAMAEQWG